MLVPYPAFIYRWFLLLALTLCPVFAQAQAPTIIVTELNYSPGTGQPEFLEIKNIGTSPVVLNSATVNFEIDTGISFSAATMTAASATIPPKGFRVLVRDSDAAVFNSVYPAVAVHGYYTGGLGNGGERIRLRAGVAGNKSTFFDLTYDNKSPWPSLPDASGFTLVSADPNANPNPNDPLSWRPSTNAKGSPGADDPTPPAQPIVISEIQTRNDTVLNNDTFELANLSDSPVEIGNWFLTDDFDSFDPAKVALDPTLAAHKFKIPAGTTVPARGYVTFTQAQAGFGMSGSGGDELILFAATPAGALTGYKHSARPGAGLNQRSFNRVVSLDGREFFQPSLSNTLGAANSGVYVGPVIFSEINYKPSAFASTPAVVKSEYIELVNRSSQPVNLFSSDPNITLATEKSWRVKGIYGATNVDFAFPANTTLAAGEVALLIPALSVSNEPTLIANFRTANKVPASVTKIFVYYAFNDATGAITGLAATDGNILANGGQILELVRPERIASVSNAVPPVTTYTVNFLTEDFAAYENNSDWPQKADGDAPIVAPAVTPSYYSRSLVRVDSNRFAGDPRAWDNSVAHGGTPGYALFPASRSVVVNEILAHTDLIDPSHESRTDFIELHNPTAAPLNITGWWLTNNPDQLAAAYDKRLANPAYVMTSADSVYEIPSTTILAGGFWSVNGDNDDNTNTIPPVGFFGRSFSLNSRGDSCYLVAYDAVSNRLLGYVHGFGFDATENPVALIRYRNTEGRETLIPAQSITTSFSLSSAFPVGAANSAPRVPSVIITEFMNDAAVGGYEFIEIHNKSTSAVALYDTLFAPSNNWRISGIDFTFPGSFPTLAAGETVIVTNAPSPADFRAHFTTTPVSTRIFPWTTGLLSNQGERIKLQRPDKPDIVGGSTVVPYINVDEVAYLPDAPWAPVGFGGGYSLERKNLNYIADDASNWQRSATALGTPGVVPATQNTLALWNQLNYSESEIIAGTNLGAFDDFNGDGFPNFLHYLYGLNPKTKPLNSQLPAVGLTSISSQDYLTLSYREQAGTTDFGLTAQETVNLLSWGTANIQSVSRIALGGGVDQVTVRFTTPLSSTSKAFLRLTAGAK